MLFFNKCRNLCSIILPSTRDHCAMTSLLTGHFLVRPWSAEIELLGKQMIRLASWHEGRFYAAILCHGLHLYIGTLLRCFKDKLVAEVIIHLQY